MRMSHTFFMLEEFNNFIIYEVEQLIYEVQKLRFYILILVHVSYNSNSYKSNSFHYLYMWI